MSDSGYVGQNNFPDGGSWANAIQYALKIFTGRMASSTLVQVQKVYPAAEGALAQPLGLVDVLPLVNTVDSFGNAIPHGTVFGLPYFRLQGGSSAVIMDPVVGDIGMAAFASRDISAVKRTKKQSNPGSFRRFDMADGMYFGGFLNGAPTQFIEFLSGGGIKVTTPGNLVVSAANATLDADGNLTTKGNITWNTGTVATDAAGHKHDNVQNGGSQTNPPVPGT